MSRCLPFGSTASTRRPLSRAMVAGRASLTTLPAMRRRNAAAVRQMVSPSGKAGPALRPENDALRRGATPGFAQHPFQRRLLDRGAVDALDLELVHASGNRRERLEVRRLRVAGRQQRPSTALEVEPQFATVEHDIGARRPGHPRLVLGPWNSRSVWARRVGGRQRHDLRVLIARGAEPVDGARKRELQATQAVDEVPPPDLARFLHRPEHRIECGKAAADALRQRRLAGQDAIALQQRARHGVQVFRIGHSWAEQITDQGPAPGRRRWPESHHRTARVSTRPRPEHAQWEECVVRDLAGPDHVPERVAHRILVARAGRVIEVTEERGAAPLEMFAQAFVDLAGGALIRFSNQPCGIGSKVEGDAPIRTAQRSTAGPDHVSHRDQLIEQLWPVVAHPHRAHIALEHRCRDGAALELENDLVEPVESARLDAPAMPATEEPAKYLDRYRLDLAS